MYQFMIEKVSLWNEYSEVVVPKLYKHNNLGWGSLHLITHIVAYIKKQKFYKLGSMSLRITWVAQLNSFLIN